MIARRSRSAIVITALTALIATAAPAQVQAGGGLPSTWIYPGQCQHASPTLQECIDASHPGDTVEIATDTPIAESVVVNKSLTLEAAGRSHPSIRSIIVVYAGSTLDVTVQDW